MLIIICIAKPFLCHSLQCYFCLFLCSLFLSVCVLSKEPKINKVEFTFTFYIRRNLCVRKNLVNNNKSAGKFIRSFDKNLKFRQILIFLCGKAHNGPCRSRVYRWTRTHQDCPQVQCGKNIPTPGRLRPFQSRSHHWGIKSNLISSKDGRTRKIFVQIYIYVSKSKKKLYL